MGRFIFIGGNSIDQPEFVDVTATTIGTTHTNNSFTFSIPNGRNGQLVLWLVTNGGYTTEPTTSAAGVAGTRLQSRSGTGAPTTGALFVWDAPVTAVTTIGYQFTSAQFSGIMVAAFYKNVNQADSYSGTGDENVNAGVTVRINTSTTAEFRNGLYVMGVACQDEVGTFSVSAGSGLTTRVSIAVAAAFGCAAYWGDKALSIPGLASAAVSLNSGTSAYAAALVLNGSTKGT